MSISFRRFLPGLLLAVMSCGFAAERIILDTDLGDDVDDAGTLAVLHALADRGEIEILAVGIVNGNVHAVPLTDAINTWYGRPDLPVGTIKAGAPINHDRFKMGEVAAQYPHDLTQATAPDVIGLYRSILAQQPDRSVTLVVVGQATNVANLLKSQPDAHSPLNGVELMRRKIGFYAAGGNGRATLPHGQAGWNYMNDLTAARYELEHLPSDFPTVFAGGSGLHISVGSCYQQAPADHIIRKCYEAYFGGVAKDRQTWDQIRLLYGSRPAARTLWDRSANGDITLDASGILTWSATPDRNRSYAYVNDHALMKQHLTELMMHVPTRPPTDPAPLRINFQPASGTVPQGYVADTGAIFGDRGNGLHYGWLGSANNETRTRNWHTDRRYDTLNHMQNKGTARVWEIALPSGTYRVRLVMGDPRYADQTNHVFLEDQLLVDPDGVDLIDEYHATVTVSDGRLTIRPNTDNGSVGAKIMFIEITPESPMPAPQVDVTSLVLNGVAANGTVTVDGQGVAVNADGTWTTTVALPGAATTTVDIVVSGDGGTAARQMVIDEVVVPTSAQ